MFGKTPRTTVSLSLFDCVDDVLNMHVRNLSRLFLRLNDKHVRGRGEEGGNLEDVHQFLHNLRNWKVNDTGILNGFALCLA